MDAGGLAQMTYNNHNSLGGGLGMPATGFGSRGKGGNIKRLSVPGPAAIATINENNPAPRTSRSHLLAGLRTAPKSPSFPTSAPPNQLQQPGLRDSHLSPLNAQYKPPKTATGMGFGGYPNQGNYNTMNQLYSPEQVLAPPSLQFGDNADGAMDPQVYDELVRTNQYLAQQQMRLQQQLINVTAAAQQFQQMNLGQTQGSAFGHMASPAMSVYHQQLSQGVQPVIQAVPGSPGLFTVYNPLTGQTSLAFDNNAAEAQADATDMGNPAVTNAPAFRTNVASPPSQSPSPPASRSNNWRSNSPPKISTTPPREDTLPLPPPSANAFRTGHRKNNLSLVNGGVSIEGPRTAGLKSTGFPRTPMTGTFGPGQAQEGEHPARQPRGPPSMEELLVKPTTKHEGSKNFASRQRRSAVKNLVRAGLERRGNRSNGSIHSADSGSPTSENGSLSTLSDDDISVRSGSASLEGKPSLDKLPPSPNVGVIGAERKELRERSRERQVTDYSAVSISSDDDMAIGGRLVEVKLDAAREADRMSPLQLLANAEKRRSLLY